MINWFILRFSPSIAIRIVSWLKYRDTYRIVRVPYRYAPIVSLRFYLTCLDDLRDTEIDRHEYRPVFCANLCSNTRPKQCHIKNYERIVTYSIIWCNKKMVLFLYLSYKSAAHSSGTCWHFVHTILASVVYHCVPCFALTHSPRNFWHPFSRSVRNYFVDARKNHGYGYKNWYISVTNIARHKICTSLDLWITNWYAAFITLCS